MNFQTPTKQSQPRISSTVSRIALAVALTLSANGAIAAPVHNAAATTHHVVRHVAAAKRPIVRRQPGLVQFFGLFGLPIPVAVATHAARGTVSSDSGGYDPAFDTPSPPVDVDNSQSQAAIEASDQALQQMNQNMTDLDASIAASEAQNDAANAAMVQEDVNAGM